MRAIHRGRQLILDFLASEAAGGLVLMAAAALALAVANSPFSENYIGALHTYIGPLSVHHWINDAAMALFFLLVGLEIKRELVHGELRDPRTAALCVACLLALVMAGCSSPPVDESANATAERLYKDAKEDMESGSYERALKTLERVEGLAAGRQEGELAAGASQPVTLALPVDAVSQVLVTFHAVAAPDTPVPRVTLADQLTR